MIDLAQVVYSPYIKKSDDIIGSIRALNECLKSLHLTEFNSDSVGMSKKEFLIYTLAFTYFLGRFG